MLNTDPARFKTDGYCLFRDIFDPHQVAEMQQRLTTAIEEASDATPHYYNEPHTKEKFWLDVCSCPRLLDAVESVLGPNIILVFSSMFIKPPRDDTSVAWHQDTTYWASVHGTDVLTVWLAIDDVDHENAPMQVIPGSHRRHQQLDTVKTHGKEWFGNKVEITAEQAASATSLIMNAGSLSLHDSYLIHGGGINTSDRQRAGYTIRFCSTDTAWVDIDQHPIPVYLVRGEPGSRGREYVDLRPAG